MFLIKLIGATILSLTGMFMGINSVNKLKKRADSLDWFYKSLLEIATRISVSAAELSDIIISLYGYENYLKIYKPFKLEITTPYLKSGDKEILVEFFSSLGLGDIHSETKRCELYSKIIEERYKSAKSEYLQKSKLYKMLGLFSGLSLAIIIM